SMTLDMANTDKLAVFVSEARRSGIEIKPPCVNSSEVEFLAEPAPQTPDADGRPAKGAIRYALAALKNVGPSAVRTIVDSRVNDGPFRSIADFASRLNPKAVNKRAIEMLAQSGALDVLVPDRATATANADLILA